jgi:hypothetical protein
VPNPKFKPADLSFPDGWDGKAGQTSVEDYLWDYVCAAESCRM